MPAALVTYQFKSTATENIFFMSTPSSKLNAELAEQLKKIILPSLNDDFLNRLVAAADGTDLTTSLTQDTQANKIGSIQPSPLGAGLNSKLLEAIGDAPFHKDEKIVLFNKPNRTTKSRKIVRFNLAAAAAVALLGCMTALFLPDQQKSIAENDAKPVSASTQSAQASTNPNFVPASFSRNLSDARDEGVIWRNQAQPLRLLRFTYMDEVQLRDETGKIIQVSKPKFEYVILPENID